MGSTKIVSILFAVLAGLQLIGCATILKGKNENVSLTSTPEAANVVINGQPMGTTPLKLKLDSTRGHTVEFQKAGYRSKSVILNHSVGAGWVVLDVILGLVPVIVDAATGDWQSLDESTLKVTLERAKEN